MRHNHVFMRFPGGVHKALTFSFDDGSDQDRWLCGLLKSLGLKGTFNLNMGLLPPHENFDFSTLDDTVFPVKKWQRRLTEKEIREVFTGSGMELATHGYLHAELPRLDDDALIWEIMQDRIALERITGEPVRGHAYAQGAFDDRVCETLKRAGIVYARTAFFTGGFNLPKDFMRWGPSCGYCSPNAVSLADTLIEAKPGRNKYFGDTEAMLLYIFAHSYEFEVNNNYDVMESLATKLAGKDDIWYCTNMEYYNYVTVFRNLDYGLERNFVRNPSAIPVWIFVNDKVAEVPAGETVAI